MGLGTAEIEQGVKPLQKAHQKRVELPEIPHPLCGLVEAKGGKRVAADCPPASAHPEYAATCC